MPTWPATLPQDVLRRGYSETPRMVKATFESDTGPPIERPKGTIKLTKIPVSMIMTSTQLSTFEDFVFDDLAQGSLSFTFPHPRLGQNCTAKITGDEPYQVAEIGADVWTVSFELLVIG